MRKLFSKSSLFLFLFELGFGVKFHLIGEISISEIFLLIYVPIFILPKIRWRKAKEFRIITIAYISLLSFQIFSEIMVGNEPSNALRGIAIRVVSYLHFMFLAYLLIKQKSLILALILSQITMKLIFGTSFEEQSMEDIMLGEAAVYLKFYIAPLLILAFLAISIVYAHKHIALFFALLGSVLILLGARSSGGMALLSGLIAYLIEYKFFTYNKRMLWLSILIVLIGGYAFYVYYVNQVLSGEITSGNSWQIFLCKNPYNPLELLIVGRREMWVGWQAFMDQFWLGHGAWAYDTTGHYQRLMYMLTDDLSALTKNRVSFHFLIPSHSVLVGSGVMNGIGAFASMFYIVFYFVKRGFMSFKECDNRFKLVLVYYVFDLIWTTLFSPQSHFRLSIPIAFSIIFVIYIQLQRKKKNTIQYEFK